MPDKMEELLAQVERKLDEINERDQNHPDPVDEEQVRNMVNAAIQELTEDEDFQRKIRFSNGDNDRKLMGTKYARWGLTPEDVEFLYDMQHSLRGQRKVNSGGIYEGPSEELENTFSAISDAFYLDADEVKRIDQRAIDDMFPRINKANIEAYEKAMRAMDSSESGYGSELIGAQYVGDLWEGARPNSRVFGLLDSFEMTAPTAYLPVEADIPEMLFVSESTGASATNYDTVKTGSNRVQVDAKKFVIHQMWSGELEEDSIIPFIPFLRRQAQLALAHYSDSLVLNGDTTNAATGNINLDDADPADTKHYLAFDGLRHVGLVDNTDNGNDISGAISPSDFPAALERMKDADHLMHWGMPTDPNDVVHIMDSATYMSMLGLDDVHTVDKFGPNATILTGQLASIYNHPIITSEAVSLTEADGKVSSTDSNNTVGQIVTFNRRGFVAGWRRRVRLETERLPATDQTRLVYSLRLGFGRFSPTGAASGIEPADVMYNITV